MDHARWCLQCPVICVLLSRGALVRTSVFAHVCLLSESFVFEFCVARCDGTTEWTELKLQVFRSARDQTHSRVIHCPLPVASVCDCESGCLGLLSLAVYGRFRIRELLSGLN